MKLKGLLDAGVLTQAEFDDQKTKLLGARAPPQPDRNPPADARRTELTGEGIWDQCNSG